MTLYVAAGSVILDDNALLPPAVAPMPPPVPVDTPERRHVLAASDIDSLDNDPELAELARFAAKLCDAPIAVVNVVEPQRQRFLARHGLPVSEAPAAPDSFCVHAMGGNDLLEVPDAQVDPRFSANAFVAEAPHIRFYAGEPLVAEDGTPLGALCVIDTAPRPQGLNEFQRDGLHVLAQAAMRRLRSRRHSAAAKREQDEREIYLRTLADSIPAIAWSATPDGHFDYFNKRMVDFTGKDDEQQGDDFHPDDWKKASAAWQHSLASGETYEIEHRLRRHDGEYRWMISRAVPVRDSSGAITRWFGTAVDIHDIYEASESRDLLAKELSHRIKNIFAVVAGLVSLSVRRRPEHKPFADELLGTIHALGRAHDYVRPSGMVRHSGLHGLLADLFQPYCADKRPCVEVSGDDVKVSAQAATPLALVFHELATNSAKYGALSAAGGTVGLSIRDLGDTVALTWAEHGGPPVAKERADGFGSRLVEMSVTGTLGGQWERRFEPGGLVIDLTLSKKAIAGR